MNIANAQRIRELQHQARTATNPARQHALLLQIADLMQDIEPSTPGSEKPHPDLFDFSGSDYEEEHDQPRLTGQIRRIFGCMADGRWRTLPEIREATGDGEASISAQLRNLRKPSFGSHTVEKRRRGEASDGLWEYRIARGEMDGG